MVAYSKVTSIRAKSMGEVCTSGLTERTIAETGAIIRSTDMEFINGQMDADTKVNGAKTNFTTEAFTHGLMVVAMTVSI